MSVSLRLYFRTFFPIFLIMGGATTLTGQDVQLYGSIPAVIVNGQLNDQWDYNLTVSSEMNVIRREFGGRIFPAEVSNLNLEGALAYDLNPNVNLAGGFLYRFRRPFAATPTRELRPWQQVTFMHYANTLRIRHRLRLEERFIQQNGENNSYHLDVRMRYRLSTDFPLEGERLDDREFYLNLSSEAVLTLTIKGVFPYWENRNYVGLGYRFNDRHRLEPALDFRTRRRNDAGDRQNILFLRLQWIYKILPAQR